MNHLLDILFLVPLAFGAYRGFKNGFVYELALLCALVAGIYFGFRFSNYAAVYIGRKMDVSGGLLFFLSFLSVFVLVAMGVILLGKLLDVSLKITGMGIINRIAGLLFGMVKWALIFSVVLYFFTPLDKKFRLVPEDKKASSVLYQPVCRFSALLIPVLDSYRKKISLRPNSQP